MKCSICKTGSLEPTGQTTSETINLSTVRKVQFVCNKCGSVEWIADKTVSSNQEEDKVNNPSHYTSGKIEVIDFIEDQKLGFCLGSAIKYICRAGKKKSEGMTLKEKAIQDLKKAIWFIQRRIYELENDINI